VSSLAKPPLKVTLSKHPEFKVIHVNGALIAAKADEGFMKFFLDILEPKIGAGGKKIEVDFINREFQVEVRMSTIVFLQIAQQMEHHIKQLEKKGILKREKKPRKAPEPYRI